MAEPEHPTGDTCKGCVFLTREFKTAQVVCTRHPPTAFLVMTNSVNGPAPSIVAAYPPVSESMTACGEYATELMSGVVIGEDDTELQ
jgi:hypothetical protein